MKNNKVFFEDIMYLDDILIERILNIMFVAKDCERHKYYIKYNDISLMNLIFRFINSYKGNNITNDIFDTFESYNRDYDIEFYICFIFYYYKNLYLNYYHHK